MQGLTEIDVLDDVNRGPQVCVLLFVHCDKNLHFIHRSKICVVIIAVSKDYSLKELVGDVLVVLLHLAVQLSIRSVEVIGT